MNNSNIISETTVKLSAFDYITLAIAIIGLLLSIFNFAKDLYEHRSKIKIDFENATLISNRTNCPILFRMTIENCSTLPISISRIIFLCGIHRYEFSPVPEIIFKSETLVKHETVDSAEYYSTELPATISGLGAIGKFFYMYTDNECKTQMFQQQSFTLELRTNRGIKHFDFEFNDNNLLKMEN